ncbi:DNA repair protein rad5 [Leucoagaricus sp. SymC.cos]|nr:DNA repair protein rad5 [Leucoagaricus sp. SymC.cos]
MQFCPSCAICCTICAQKQLKTPLYCAFGDPLPKSKQPFALNNLLAAGTVTIQRVPQSEPSLCDHFHADDGWHDFEGLWHSGYLGQDDAELAKQLRYLVRNDFIRTTYNISSAETMTLRIYFVPVNLKDVKGRLHHNNRPDGILSQARRYLKDLLPRISQNIDQWYGHSSESISKNERLIYAPPDGRTLAEIYSDLASPTVEPTCICNETVARLLNYDDDLEGLGFRSILYRYQRRSIAAMITRELDLRPVPDPLYLQVSTLNGKLFYVQPGTMEMTTERGMMAPTQGGLLCEELGTGKTVMILGLILSTLNQLPSPPETTAEPPTVLTPIAFKTFPSGPYATARNALMRGKPKTEITNAPVPSLVELLLHYARATPPLDFSNPTTPQGRRLYEKRLEIERNFEMTPLNDLLQQNVPFYPEAPGEVNDSWNFRRSRVSVGPRIMYLSAATLVVVPPNLLSQWHREINKHCERPLRVLVLRSGTKAPLARSLANDFDIILMTYNRYAAEAMHKDILKLYSLPPCGCPDIPGTRIPDCKCPNPTGVSPLLQVRWKRLVIDEGHVSASLSTSLTPFTKLLSVERRWIVTGTPTTNLLGLSLGKSTISEFISHTDKEDYSYESQGVWEEENVDDSPISDQGTPLSSSAVKQRIWNKYDREDLNKLDNMITHFIAVPHFIANSKLMSTHLRDPLMDKDGPRPGSIQVLAQVMEMIMIRHRIEDVEKDISLPPVVHESILLDLDPVVAKSYNALQATIAINAIDSERTDQDYLFHSKNTEYLQLTVKNMSQLMFWSVDETLYNVDQLVENAQSTIDRALQRNIPPEDIQLVRDAFHHIQLAAADQLWRQIQTHEDIPYRVYKMSERIHNAWSRTLGLDSQAESHFTGMVHADRLLKLQSLITAQPLMSEDLLIEQGAEVAKTDMEHQNAAKKAAAPDTLKEMRKELDQSLAKLERDEEEDNSTGVAAVTSNANAGGNVPSVLLGSSVLADVVMGSSASSKLNYIINEVVKHSADEKMLIFSDSELTLAHVAEALELVQIKFLRFTTQVQPQVREQLVLTFETSETYRVFLMELKHGARGLNLISASRVIFCEPVWQADVESQAIKRAHRIGQTRAITVKTLAIRGTAEENMVGRRNMLKSSHGRIPKLIEESGMRHFIANPKFLTHVPERLPKVELPLLHFPRHPTTPPSAGSLKLKIPVLLEEPLKDNDYPVAHAEHSPHKKMAKAVHFG